MSQTSSPFTQSQLLPQEEMLELSKKKGQLFIGIPKEISYQEKRVCLTPDAVSALTANGHRVLIEKGAGLYAKFSNRDYSEAGAEVTNDKNKIFYCPIILKVAPLCDEELEMIHPQTTLISALQLKTRHKDYFQKLAQKRVTALAFEFIKDEFGAHPAVRTLSEIAGSSSVLIAAELLANVDKANGLLLGNISGVPPTEVVIIGAGTVGESAAKSAIGLGASIKVFDSSITRLRNLSEKLNQNIFTSTIQPKSLTKALQRADVVIGAVRGKNRSPVIVSKKMVQKMKKGAVIIDVSIDMGGCFETSEMTNHNEPIKVIHGVIHYCVPNIPSRYPRTSSISISNIFTPYLLHIGEEGGIENTLRYEKGLRNGLYLYRGILTSKSVAKWFDLDYKDPNLLIF